VVAGRVCCAGVGMDDPSEKSNFPGPTAQDRRLEEIAIGAVPRRLSVEIYHRRVVQLKVRRPGSLET
jgi:hypothetical protein